MSKHPFSTVCIILHMTKHDVIYRIFNQWNI